MTLWDMIHWLHILIAVALLVPTGLLEHCSTDWRDCGSSSLPLEDTDAEDAESASRLELQKFWLFVDPVEMPGCMTLVLTVFPKRPSNSVQIECAELRGCRPPPSSVVQ